MKSLCITIAFIVIVKVLSLPTCSLGLSSPFHYPSRSYGWWLQPSTLNQHCAKLFTWEHSLPVVGNVSSSILIPLRFIFIPFPNMAHTNNGTTQPHLSPGREESTQAAGLASTAQTKPIPHPRPYTLQCPVVYLGVVEIVLTGLW